jgi:hypothetical protein
MVEVPCPRNAYAISGCELPAEARVSAERRARQQGLRRERLGALTQPDGPSPVAMRFAKASMKCLRGSKSDGQHVGPASAHSEDRRAKRPLHPSDGAARPTSGWHYMLAIVPQRRLSGRVGLGHPVVTLMRHAARD